MSDSDSDAWDADDFDVDKKLEEAQNKKVVRSEDEAESSEDENEKRREAEAAEARAKAKAKAEAKAKAQAEIYVPLNDAKEEKKRRQKLIEERDARLAEDLFAGCDEAEEKKEERAKAEAAKAAAAAAKAKAKAAKNDVLIKDAFDDVELKTQADVDKLVSTCIEKVEKSKAKSAASKLLTDLIKALEPELETRDLDNFVKTLASIEKAKKVEKASSNAEKRKGNEKLDKHTKFNASDEVGLVYGGGDEDWEDWDDWEEY
eukprot:TRINITY_DN39155_c0_g1_i1.p1 TRINITY_DN39155_c0_g1~~TRINITY_DN39155_c0_g1_i1.p1  ORF type:complete len:260 (+),score=128.90 TRINITY_DN39155_c0_g1_i1:71-850(+)